MRRIRRIFWCLVPIGWVFGSWFIGSVFAQPEASLYAYGQALRGLEEKKLYETTLDALKTYMVQYPEFENAADVQFSLAQVHDTYKNRDQAFVSYLKLIRLYPKSPKIGQAVENTRRVVSDDSNLSPIKEKLISLLVASAEKTAFPDVYLELLQGLRDLLYPKLNEALISECRLFVESYPEYAGTPLVAEWIGDMYTENGEHWEALAAYLRVVHLYGSSLRVTGCRLKIADLFGDRLKRYDEAVRTYEAMLSSSADSSAWSEAQWKLALVLERNMRNYRRAADEYEKLADVYPGSVHRFEALVRKANLHVSELQQYEAGIQTYLRAVENHPEDSNAPDALAQAAEVYEKRMKDYENAIRLYRELSDKYPSNALASEKLFRAAELAERNLKDTSRALMLYEEVVNKFGSERIADKARRKVDTLKKNVKSE
ncbi:MAG: tetratricopeptide repeat protein [bacterium]